MAKKFTPEETARLQEIINQYGNKPIPKEVYDALSAELGRPKGSLHSAIYGLRKEIDSNGTVDKKKLSDAIRYITWAVTATQQENADLKRQLRALKDVLAAVEKFQGKEVI